MNVYMQTETRKLILKFEFLTAIDFILHELFAPLFVYGRFVILICAVFPPPPSWPSWHRKYENGLQFQFSGAQQLPKEEDSGGMSLRIRLVQKIPVLTTRVGLNHLHRLLGWLLKKTIIYIYLKL